MDSDEHFQTLEEFVYDENKIVTYTWLSTKLAIEVGLAKDLLTKYVRHVRQTKPTDLSVTHVIVGTKADKSLTVTLSKEQDLKRNMSTYETVTAHHVYGVQRSKDVDFSVFFLVEPFRLQEKPLLGSVVGKNCVRRTLKVKTIAVPEKPIQSSIFKKSVLAGATDDITKTKKEQNGIAGFFPKTQSEGSIKDTKKAGSKNNIKAKSNAIMGNFFTKGLTKTNCDSVDSVTTKSDSSSYLSSKETESDSVKIETEAKKKSKRSRKDNTSERPTKKRKRIVERNDSDSDDIFGDEDEEAASAEENSIVVSTDDEINPVPQPKPSIKKRKHVTRTFTDEDGYIITKKEWVLENESGDDEKENSKRTFRPDVIVESESAAAKSASETDASAGDDERKPPKAIENTVKELPSKKKGKQPDKKPKNQQTLLNFFRKT